MPASGGRGSGLVGSASFRGVWSGGCLLLGTCSALGGGGLVPGGAYSGGSSPWGGACSQEGASRPTPKGQVEGDQVQAHTQGGN